ncbi:MULTISPECIES: tetratricopeptide repeat protein, partial [unclassified Frankia]|uniref:tetratricopeptide repeat protein n=1 Tax=unclassified Frankia TaxID=2632575 RepID=UPI002AD525F7
MNEPRASADLAAKKSALAITLSHSGRREEALTRAVEAVATYRRLAETSPDAFLPDLAASLNNLAAFLSEVGRRAEALMSAEEAVAIRRR